MVAEPAVGLEAAGGAFVGPGVADFVAVQEVEGAVLGGEGGDGAAGGAGPGADLVGVFGGGIGGLVGLGGCGLAWDSGCGSGCRLGSRLPDLVGNGDGFHDDGAVATPGGEGHGVD